MEIGEYLWNGHFRFLVVIQLITRYQRDRDLLFYNSNIQLEGNESERGRNTLISNVKQGPCLEVSFIMISTAFLDPVSYDRDIEM